MEIALINNKNKKNKKNVLPIFTIFISFSGMTKIGVSQLQIYIWNYDINNLIKYNKCNINVI